MRKPVIAITVSGLGLALALLLVGAGAWAVELGAGASFNTVAMDYLNEIISAYNARMGLSFPSLTSGLGFFGSLMLGLSPLDLGLGAENLSASVSSPSESERGRVSFTASASGVLGLGSFALLRGGLELRLGAALGRYSASYSSDLEEVAARGEGLGYKLGLLLGLRLTRSLALNAVLNFRALAFDELVDQRGNPLTVRERPYLDFSGLELGAGVGWRF